MRLNEYFNPKNQGGDADIASSPHNRRIEKIPNYFEGV